MYDWNERNIALIRTWLPPGYKHTLYIIEADSLILVHECL